MANHAGKARLARPSRWPTAAQLLVAGLGAVVFSSLVAGPPLGGRAYGAAIAFLVAGVGTTLFVLVSGWNADRDPHPLFLALFFMAPGAIVALYSDWRSAGQALTAAVASTAFTALYCGAAFRAVKEYRHVKAARAARRRKAGMGPKDKDFDPEL